MTRKRRTLESHKRWLTRRDARKLARLMVLRAACDLESVSAEEFLQFAPLKAKPPQLSGKQHGGAAKVTKRRKKYEMYITSEKWFAFRRSIIADRGYHCEDCGKNYGKIHLHHLNYKHLGHELPGDVRLLCVDCHQAKHQGRRLKAH